MKKRLDFLIFWNKLELNGINWNERLFLFMISFCGYDKCLVDANGRVKLAPGLLADFGGAGAPLVIRLLPEGGIALYPESIFLKMRAGTEEHLPAIAESALVRRRLRALNAMSASVQISPQGRITLPEDFRERAGLKESPEAVIVGVDTGAEIWSRVRWQAELDKLDEHYRELDKLEMQSDLKERC